MNNFDAGVQSHLCISSEMVSLQQLCNEKLSTIIRDSNYSVTWKF